MINKKIQDAFNGQIKNELESSYLYLSMAAWFHSEGLDGFAGWMKVQAKEETLHAMKFYDNIVERMGTVELPALSKPKAQWNSSLAAFQDAFRHEQLITSKINGLVKLADDQNDNAAGIFLQWFVNEQVEEESAASKIVQLLERIGASGAGLVMLDKQLGKREFSGEAREK